MLVSVLTQIQMISSHSLAQEINEYHPLRYQNKLRADRCTVSHSMADLFIFLSPPHKEGKVTFL